MFANFQSNGTTPLDNDSVNIGNNGLAKVSAQSFNIFGCIPSSSRNKSENYRPVSLTSVICKLLERLIKDHMVDFLVKHK